MLKEFKAFISKGNVIDLAVALILGAAFTQVVNTFTNGILMNLIAAIFGKPNFDALTFRIGNGVIEYGKFLTAIANFLLVAVALFALIKGLAAMQASRTKPRAEEPKETDHDLLAQIRDALVERERGQVRS